MPMHTQVPDRSLTNAVRAIVRIQTPPVYDPRTGKVRPGELFGFDTADEDTAPMRDLLALMTSKKLHEPCGRFTLHFTPREVRRGDTWADLIPGYSLVEIYLQSYPTNPEPVLVMLGLTDADLVSEEFGQAAPHRDVQVSGRELSCIFVDQKTLYLPVPPEQMQPRAVLAGEAAKNEELAALYQPVTQLLGMAAIDPGLVFEGATPVDAIRRFVEMVRVGFVSDYNKNGLPLLNFEFPDARLADLIFFDAEAATQALFDIDGQVRLPAASQYIRSDVPLWHLMEAFSDPAYQELFTETVERGAVEIIFRKKPFGGAIVDGKVAGVRGPRGSQFDKSFEIDPTVTIEIGDQDVQGLSLSRSVQYAQNLYYVFPQDPSINNPIDFRALYAPLIDASPDSPASIRRLGLRLRNVADYYIRDQRSETAMAIATERARLLWAWHRFESLFYRGTYVLRGQPELRVGKRLLHTGRRFTREYYVTGVTHSLTVASQAPRFATQVTVERGWPLA